MRRPLATPSLGAVHVVPARRPAHNVSVEEYGARPVLVAPEHVLAHTRDACVDGNRHRG